MQKEAAQKVDAVLRRAFEKQRKVISLRAIPAPAFVYLEVPFAVRRSQGGNRALRVVRSYL
jgi:hypothetical protein